MNQKLETIRQACIKANPEIVELKFGCEMENGSICLTADDTGIELYDEEKNESFWLDMEEFGDTKVLGRPIRLADVLLMIKTLSSKDFLVDVSGSFCETVSLDGLHVRTVKGIHWNLRADDLTQQSESTVNFLYDLLK